LIALDYEAKMNTKQLKKEEAIDGSFFRAPQAARYLGLSTSTLAKMRLSGNGPPVNGGVKMRHSGGAKLHH
jgi:hypothetical protein